MLCNNFAFIPFESELKRLSYLELSPWVFVAWALVAPIRGRAVASLIEKTNIPFILFESGWLSHRQLIPGTVVTLRVVF